MFIKSGYIENATNFSTQMIYSVYTYTIAGLTVMNEQGDGQITYNHSRDYVLYFVCDIQDTCSRYRCVRNHTSRISIILSERGTYKMSNYTQERMSLNDTNRYPSYRFVLFRRFSFVALRCTRTLFRRYPHTPLYIY